MALQNIFVHHVFFWLVNSGEEKDRDALVAGLKKLSGTKIIKQFHIGLPANTNRDVIERSYDVSWLLIFDTAAEQDSYQSDPDHLLFVKECSHLWKKVVVYDTVDA